MFGYSIAGAPTAASAPERLAEDNRLFLEHLTALHHLNLSLCYAETPDELCRQAVEFANAHLGLERIGVWTSDGKSLAYGTFGIDEGGKLRDERHSVVRPLTESVMARVLFGGERFAAVRDAPQFNDRGEQIGMGWHCIAALWDGREVIGCISADNHLKGAPLTEQTEDLIQLLASTVGNLLSRKRTEISLRESEAEVRSMNATLESRVADRTAELLQAYKELEGFTYSVSHDFRAPLRAIMATSMILLQDYGDALSVEAREQLHRQAQAAKRLGKLMDDLLQFSRLGRAEIDRQNVDLGTVGLEIATGIEEHQRNPIQIHVQPALAADADPTLIRLVLENLLENAFKYRKKDQPLRIEIGANDEDGQTVYYVSDNGIGFDSRFAERMFLPFERLHREDDYPGTGIGLANVKRIIERHGGRVWAEGEEGKGARVLFTLS